MYHQVAPTLVADLQGWVSVSDWSCEMLKTSKIRTSEREVFEFVADTEGVSYGRAEQHASSKVVSVVG